MKAFLLTSIALFGTFSLAGAQSIETGELGGAESYEPGTLAPADGALGSHLWTGTSALTAIGLLENTLQSYKNTSARDLVRTTLLSPGAPPSGAGEERFSKARLDAIIRLSEMAAAQDIAKRTPRLSASRELQADMALLAGNVENACTLSDSIVDARRESYWMKLRAFCHAKRGETAAADLTLDLLRSTSEPGQGYIALMRRLTGVPGRPDLSDLQSSPISIAMMKEAGLDWPKDKEPPASAAQRAFNPLASADDRLSAMFRSAHALSDAQLTQIIEGLAQPSLQNADGLAGAAPQPVNPPSLEDALADKGAAGFEQLYKFLQFGDYENRLPALIELLSRADTAGRLDRFSSFLGSNIAAISYLDTRQEDISLLTRVAVYRNDIGALQQIHGLLDNRSAAQDRVALAADALGNGFYGGTLGIDIDSRLAGSGKIKSRALRDALLANALGAHLSEAGLDAIETRPSFGRFGGDLLVLETASRLRAPAETALRTAQILEKGGDKLPDLTIYMAVRALYDAGLQDPARKIAALDFLSDFPE